MTAVRFDELPAGDEAAEIRPVGAWLLLWRRIRRDRLALSAAACLLLIGFAVTAGGPIVGRILGTGPNDLHPYAVNENLKPVGPWTRVAATPYFGEETAPERGKTTLLVLGADSQLGRDELQRLLYGGRVSLTVAAGGALLAIAIGVLLGWLAAAFGGLVDAAVSRLTDLVMSLPVLLVMLFIGVTWGDRLNDITFGVLNQGVFALILMIGLVTWFYPARISRALLLELKNREFVDAARMIGAGEWRILLRHLVPHLLPQLIVYGTLMTATNVPLEAGLTFLGVGVELPTASWGSMLAQTWGTVRNPNAFSPTQTQVLLTLWPSVMIFLSVLSLYLLGEGVRDALDPRGRRR